MQIGIAQLNPTVGDFENNSLEILKSYRQLCENSADFVITGELALCGYTPRDLLLRSEFVDKNLQALKQIAAQVGRIPLLVGFVERNPDKTGKPYYNSAAWCQEGEVKYIGRKSLLPNYDVFDEDRYFEPAKEPLVVTFNGKKIGITLCEDIWNFPCEKGMLRYANDPISTLKNKDLDVVVNLSASPWFCGKVAMREKVLEQVAKICQCPVAYCNLIGGNDELIFDGRSVVVNEKGETIHQMKAFETDVAVVDLSDKKQQMVKQETEVEEIYHALVLGLRDYARKCHFKKVVLGLSGGIDSAVVASVAAAALGSENVVGLLMPSKISSDHSISDAQKLADNLGINAYQFPIGSIVDSVSKVLDPVFQGTELNEAEENLQARTRGLLVMGMSNKFGLLALSTGNKSEMSVGYCTLYGDMCGGLGVISDVPKTKVYKLANYINRDNEIIPNNTITKPPSAELRPDQKDEDSLPDYDTLDAILEMYLAKGQSAAEIIEAGFDEAIVSDILHKVDRNEYKRRQAAPGLKVQPIAFGVGRRIPIVFKR